MQSRMNNQSKLIQEAVIPYNNFNDDSQIDGQNNDEIPAFSRTTKRLNRKRRIYQKQSVFDKFNKGIIKPLLTSNLTFYQ